MITNISKRLTTVALATAGSVAAFGFATTAPAQAVATCPTPMGQMFSDFRLPNPLTSPCIMGDKLFTFLSAEPGAGTIDNGVVLIEETTTTTMDRHTFNYRPSPALTQAAGAFVIRYTIEIDDPAKMFKSFSIGYDATGAGNFGIFTEKTVWSDAIGGMLIGTSTATTALGASGAMVSVPSGITKLYVQDTYRVDDPMGSLNSITNDFTQKTKSIDIPEPSAILGILAVAGAGAFARRKS